MHEVKKEGLEELPTEKLHSSCSCSRGPLPVFWVARLKACPGAPAGA